ncbi:hypothetical protein QQS21_012950, partial [Conoideocrella luteorostrata]
CEDLDASDDAHSQHLVEEDNPTDEDDDNWLHTLYFTDGIYNGRLAAGILANQATTHALTKEDLCS